MEMNRIRKQFSFCLMALMLTGCRSLNTPVHSWSTSPASEDESMIFTKREIETRSWLMESGSRAVHKSSKAFYFKNHSKLLAATYGPATGSVSTCVDFYRDAGAGHYTFLVHDFSKVPIESIESVEDNGKVSLQIFRGDKQTGAHESYSYGLTESESLIPGMSHFTWNDKDVKH